MSYSNIVDHQGMVFDGLRNAAYARALKKIITPDSVVLDLGSGMGVHGLNAARLGAAEVHLVEPAPVLEVARQVAQNNGLANVHYHPQRVEELSVDIAADVIVSVFTGNFLLTEDLLPSLYCARDRFLSPGGVLIPGRARMQIVPVQASNYYRDNVTNWQSSLAFCEQHHLPPVDYSIASGYAANSLYYDSARNFDATRLAKTTGLLEFDFYSAVDADCDARVEVVVERDGLCHGWIGSFSMQLEEEWLSTGLEDDATHWRQVFLPLTSPLDLKEGDTVDLRIKRPAFGEWSWITEANDISQQQSTFLSRPLRAEEVRKKSLRYRPTLKPRGEAAARALDLMRGDAETGAIARILVEEHGKAFLDEGEARRFVARLANEFS